MVYTSTSQKYKVTKFSYFGNYDMNFDEFIEFTIR